MKTIAKSILDRIIRYAYRNAPIAGDDGFDVGVMMKLRAALDSADYCIAHMPRARAFRDAPTLLSFALSQVTVQGCYLEFGVASGRSINHIARQVGTTVHGFDSFEGLPEDWHTGFERGAFAQRPPAVSENVTLHVGWFNETLPTFLENNRDSVAFLHVDCDLYSSTHDIFTFLGERIVCGTVIVFDEYLNHPTWRQDEYRAFKEFVDTRRVRYRYLGYVPKHQQVAVIIEDIVSGTDAVRAAVA